MEPLESKIEALEKKIDSLQKSINKLNRIFFWTLIVTLVLFFLPLIGLVFALPQFINYYTSILPSIGN